MRLRAGEHLSMSTLRETVWRYMDSLQSGRTRIGEVAREFREFADQLDEIAKERRERS